MYIINKYYCEFFKDLNCTRPLDSCNFDRLSKIHLCMFFFSNSLPEISDKMVTACMTIIQWRSIFNREYMTWESLTWL